MLRKLKEFFKYLFFSKLLLTVLILYRRKNNATHILWYSFTHICTGLQQIRKMRVSPLHCLLMALFKCTGSLLRLTDTHLHRKFCVDFNNDTVLFVWLSVGEILMHYGFVMVNSSCSGWQTFFSSIWCLPPPTTTHCQLSFLLSA